MVGSEVDATQEKILVADGSEARLSVEMSNKAPSRSSRLIIADDHELLRESLRSMLGHEPDLRIIDEAKDGREVIELCRLYHPDLVLMDTSMPRMNGLEATQAIKEDCPATKILLMSAYYEGYAIMSKAVMAGAEGFVSKLSPLEELVEAVRGVLQGEIQYA